MILYAIDPGPEESGLVDLRYGPGFPEPVIHNWWKWPNGDTLARLEVPEQHPTTHLAIEMPQCYGMPVGRSVLETCEWVGIFRQAFGLERSTKVYRSDVIIHLCGARNYRDEQSGKLRGHGDSSVRVALIDRFGGSKEKAIGGLKCQTCKGKGWCGRGRPTCHHCGGTKWEHPPGPLHGVTKDCWSALAVAVTYMDGHK